MLWLSSGSGLFLFRVPRWGWRPMFFIGGLPALLGLFVRFRGERIGRCGETRQIELGNLGSRNRLALEMVSLYDSHDDDDELASHGTKICIRLSCSGSGMGPDEARVITAISMVGAIPWRTVVGFLSDQFGRRRSMVAALVCAVALVPLWAYAQRSRG